MSKAEQLAAEMQRYGVTTMNRWATDGASLLRAQDALLKQALEALESVPGKGKLCNAAISAIKEATK